MIFGFRKRERAAPLAAPTTPEGVRAYVIGDVHGRADLLGALARWIEQDVRNFSGEAIVVALGDYVDRGLDSAAVVERLARGALPARLVALRGNHEQTLLNALEDESVFAVWRSLGGLETLASYGVNVSRLMRGRGFAEARRELAERLPARHRDFLAELETSFEVGDYFFCHAGVRPGVPLAEQAQEDLLWIREEFLDSDLPHGRIVVHGHTPVENPEFRSNRINIDTGAYATGRLTCLVLEGESRRLFTT